MLIPKDKIVRMGSKNHPVPSLWWRHPYCYYCGCRVVKSKVTGRASLPKNTGTVEHIPPKWIARLGNLPMKRILACYGCNNRENKRVQLLFPSFFVVLWNEGKIIEGRRKMLLPPPSRGDQDQDHQQPSHAAGQD